MNTAYKGIHTVYTYNEVVTLHVIITIVLNNAIYIIWITITLT